MDIEVLNAASLIFGINESVIFNGVEHRLAQVQDTLDEMRVASSLHLSGDLGKEVEDVLVTLLDGESSGLLRGLGQMGSNLLDCLDGDILSLEEATRIVVGEHMLNS